MNLTSLPSKPKIAAYRGYWKDITNQRRYFDQLAHQLGILRRSRRLHCVDISNPLDWHRVSVQQINDHGGSGLLRYYKGSLVQALRKIYPQESWVSWRFSSPHNVPKGSSTFSKDQYLLFQYLKRVSNEKVLKIGSIFLRKRLMSFP